MFDEIENDRLVAHWYEWENDHLQSTARRYHGVQQGRVLYTDALQDLRPVARDIAAKLRHYKEQARQKST